jgi:putative transposase
LKLRKEYKAAGKSYNSVYKALGISKQAISQWVAREDQENEILAQLELIVRDIREDHPGMALRYIFYKLPEKLIGRDRFEEHFKSIGYGVNTERKFIRTTNSRGVTKFDNLTLGLKLVRYDQLWVSDITYFEINDEFYYITFIMDAFTRLIAGHSVSETLKTEDTTIPALQMALKHRKYDSKNKPIDLIFHSDGGGQYYFKEFIKLLRALSIKSSMAETVYENSKAERINGVIKNGYLKYWSINSMADLTKSVDRAVKSYNSGKPHSSLKLETPLNFEKKLFSLQSQNRPKMKNSSKERSDRKGI